MLFRSGNGSADLALNVNVDVGSRNTAFSTFSAAQLTTFNNTAAANYGYGNYATLTTAATGGTAAVYATFLANGTGSPTAADIAAYVKAGVDTNRATLVSNEPTLAAGYNGLVISLVSVGGTNGIDVALNDLRLGDSTAAYLGDIQIIGLNVNGTKMVITGH